MKVLITTSSFGESALKVLKEEGFEIIKNPYGRKLNEHEIIKEIQGVTGLLAGLEPLNEKVLSYATTLRAIARVGIGMSNVDIEAAKKLNIKVSNTPEGPTDAVAEATLTAMLMLTRGFLKHNEEMHNAKWNKKITLGLNGANILLIGYGRIGCRVHELLTPFKANVLVYDPFVKTPYSVSLEEGLRQADVISLHASGEEVILAEKELNQLKEGAILLNPSRGSLVDENALIDALNNNRIEGVWLDTFWQEPYQGALLNYSQVLLTPHISTYTKTCRESMELAAVKNLIQDLRGN